jgi:hypothetical protein
VPSSGSEFSSRVDMEGYPMAKRSMT